MEGKPPYQCRVALRSRSRGRITYLRTITAPAKPGLFSARQTSVPLTNERPASVDQSVRKTMTS